MVGYISNDTTAFGPTTQHSETVASGYPSVEQNEPNKTQEEGKDVDIKSQDLATLVLFVVWNVGRKIIMCTWFVCFLSI